LHLPVDVIWPVWLIWRSTDRKVMPGPGGFLDQQEALLDDLLLLDALFAKVERQARDQHKENADGR
jgi:hypothetical protein